MAREDHSIQLTAHAADALNIDRRTLTALVDDGAIAAIGRGPQRRLRAADVRAFARVRDARRRTASQALADLSQVLGLDRLTSRDLPADGR